MTMTSRERVKRTLVRQETDKIPIDFGGTLVTSLDAKAHRRFCAYMGIQAEERPIIDYSMGTVEPCEELMKIFGSDFRRVSLNSSIPDIVDDQFTGSFGIRLKRAYPHDYYDMIYHPMSECTMDAIDRLSMPDPDNPALYCGLRDRARDLYENTPYAIVADFGVPGFYETSQKLRGYENLACDIILEDDFISALYDKLLILQQRFFKQYLDAVSDYVEVICYADDLGMQDRLQISPEIYRGKVKPYHTKILKFIHDNYDVKVMLHSCGSVASIIPDLTEAGFDIINPVQTRAYDMDARNLKERFGNSTIFWGGFDEQIVLPFGTEADIEAEAIQCMKVLGDGGGYIFAVSHNIQADTPPENIEKMFRYAQKYRER